MPNSILQRYKVRFPLISTFFPVGTHEIPVETHSAPSLQHAKTIAPDKVSSLHMFADRPAIGRHCLVVRADGRADRRCHSLVRNPC